MHTHEPTASTFQYHNQTEQRIIWSRLGKHKQLTKKETARGFHYQHKTKGNSENV